MLFTGSISIRNIPGRNGPFNVGVLSTEIGQFIVKDAIIEEYAAGLYEGEFDVSSNYLKAYASNGRLIIENRVKVTRIALSDALQSEKARVAAAEAERVQIADDDPADEEPKPQPAPAVATDVPSQAAKPSPEVSEPATIPADQPAAETASLPSDEELARIKEQSYRELFGPLWPFENEVRLDKTIDRLKLREQIGAMGKLGYAFRSEGQVWVKKAA